MEIINMKVVTNNILSSIKELKDVSVDYPSVWKEFPRAVYRTTRKPQVIDFEGNELQSYWTITIELYSDTHSLTNIADQLKENFAIIGFKGQFRDNNTANLKRVVCEFKAIVDNKTKIVYQA